MLTRQQLIEEVARKTGFSYKQVNAVLENTSQCVIHFISKKQGYNILWPGLGTFYNRVTTIPKVIAFKRVRIAELQYRLQNSLKDNTILLDEYKAKIERLRYDIHRLLLIRKEYLEEHQNENSYTYRAAVLAESPEYDISRLDELLDVSDIVITEAHFNKKQNDDV